MAARAELKARATLDNSQYMRGMKAMTVAAASFSVAVGNLASKAVTKLVGVSSDLVKELAEGVKRAYDLGGAMVDMSAKTGVAIDQLLILNRAAKDNGIEDIALSVKRMQVSLVSAVKDGTGPAAKALAQLGLTGEELIDKLPTDQIQRIGERIAAIRNPALRTAEAVAIFGKSGEDMLALFNDKQGLASAATALGKQAQILKENATAFDNVSDKLGHASDKLMGFFVGVAETILPAMTAAVDALDELDLAEQGERFGKGIETAVEYLTGAFEHPQVFIDSMVNYLKGGLLSAAETFAKRMIREQADEAASFADSIAKNSNFAAASLKYAFQEALELFAGGWRDLIPELAIGFVNIVTGAVSLFKKGMEAVANLDFSFDLSKAAAAAQGAIGAGAIAAGKSAQAKHKTFDQILAETSAANPMTEFGNKIRKAGEELASKMDFGSKKFLDAAQKASAALQKAGKDTIMEAAGMKAKAARLEDFQSSAYASYSGRGTSLGSSGGLTTGRLGGLRSAYNQTPLLKHREMARFQNAAVAMGDLSPDARRSSASAYHVTRSGDFRRSRNVALEKERENQKNIAKNIADTATNTKATADALTGKN